MSYAIVVTTNHEQSDGHWCTDCAPTEDCSKCGYCNPGIATDEVDYSADGHYICTEVFETTEDLDTPAHCIECGDLLDNDLTTEGEQYVRDALAEPLNNDLPLNEVEEMWAERWPNLMPHSGECTDCKHDCPWQGNRIGAPFCLVCDDHWENNDTDE